jgi:hypothetical protein
MIRDKALVTYKDLMLYAKLRGYLLTVSLTKDLR